MIIRDENWKPPRTTPADVRVDYEVCRMFAFYHAWGKIYYPKAYYFPTDKTVPSLDIRYPVRCLIGLS